MSSTVSVDFTHLPHFSVKPLLQRDSRMELSRTVQGLCPLPPQSEHCLGPLPSQLLTMVTVLDVLISTSSPKEGTMEKPNIGR